MSHSVRRRKLWSILLLAGIGIPLPSLLNASAQSTLGFSTVRIASGLSFPIFVTAPPFDARLFVVQQGGLILVMHGREVLPTPFLDLTSEVSFGGERGLLGLAFSPDYTATGLFYVNYTNTNGNTVIARYSVSADPDVADAESAEILLRIHQPFANHNGGHLAFGPDGYLYIGMGDGGMGGDPNNLAQNDESLLGKMLRIDVSGGPDSGYSIPMTNPFVGPGPPLDQIWAKGFRNPYRWSFDRETGDLYIADVGQATWEEVSVEPAALPGGGNYGWRLMEGPDCFIPSTECNDGSLTLPVHAYDHLGSRCAITGGYVYRGAIDVIRGRYFFADFCSGQVWSFVWNGGPGINDLREHTGLMNPDAGTIESIAGFGEDGFGELYIVDRGTAGTGEIYKMVDSSVRLFRSD